MRRVALLVVAGLAAGSVAGCGAAYPDLFVLTRSGSLPGAKLTLLVNDGGSVRCNGGAPRTLPDARLLDARSIVTDLSDDAHKHLVLPRPPGALLRFRLRDADGTVAFSDIDAAKLPKLGRVVAFTRTVAQDVCGFAR